MKLLLDELVPQAGQETQYLMKAEALLSVPNASDKVTLVPRALVESTLSAINIALEKVQRQIDRTTPSAQQQLEETDLLNEARRAELGLPTEAHPPGESNHAPAEDQEMESLPPAHELEDDQADQEMEMLALALEPITPKTVQQEKDMLMDDGPEGPQNESTNESQEAQEEAENVTGRSKPAPKATSGSSKASAKKRPCAKPAPKAKGKACKKKQ